MNNTFASVRDAAQEILKRREILPHQLAAFSALDRLLTADQRETFTNNWRATGGPAVPVQPAPRPHLRLSKSGQRDNRGLEVLRLQRFRNGLPMGSLDVVSGIAGRQSFRKANASRTGSLEPLPEGLWGIGGIEWASGKVDDYAASWGPGLGAVWVQLSYQGPGTTEREAIGIHLDANAAASPGSAGCVTFNKVADLKTLVSWLRADNPRELYVDWGLGTCPAPR
jgi:lysozyme